MRLTKYLTESTGFIKYARVIFTDSISGKDFDIFLKDIQVGPKFLKGVEINKKGDEMATKKVDRKIHIVDIEAIKKIKEYKMNLKYGELEKK